MEILLVVGGIVVIAAASGLITVLGKKLLEMRAETTTFQKTRAWLEPLKVQGVPLLSEGTLGDLRLPTGWLLSPVMAILLNGKIPEKKSQITTWVDSKTQFRGIATPRDLERIRELAQQLGREVAVVSSSVAHPHCGDELMLVEFFIL